jgi:type I restriction enzyme S subunit
VVEDARKTASTIDATLLAKAFRGELVPQDPNDEPAAVLRERIRQERLRNGGSRQAQPSATKARSRRHLAGR